MPISATVNPPALLSQKRAAEASEAGKLREEIVPVTWTGKKGKQHTVEADEGLRPDTSLEQLAALKPIFTADGTVTAGNAPGVNDGAGAFVLMSEEKAANRRIRGSIRSRIKYQSVFLVMS